MLANPRFKFFELDMKCPIHIQELVRNVFKFYSCVDITKSSIIINSKKIIEAKGLADSCRLMVKSMIEPESNDYIKHHIDSFNRMNENLGRYDRIVFDEFEKEVILLPLKVEVTPGSTEDYSYLRVKSFSNHLHNAVEQLVYYPLKSATDRYIILPEDYDKEGVKTKIIKDVKLFEYLLFLYLFHASESLGIWTKEDRKVSITQDMSPPEIPANIKTQELSEDEKRRQYEDFFKSPFEEVQNE